MEPQDSFFSRWVDGEACDVCTKEITQKCRCCVLATDQGLLKKAKKAERSKFTLPWHKRRMTVHHACWEDFCIKKKGRFEMRLQRSALNTVEYFDGIDKWREKVQRTADLILNSKHLVFLTGAGMSVSAGISTYRGTTGIDTQKELEQSQSEEEEKDVEYEKLRPTPSHKAIVKLEKLGYAKYIVSQNCDDLHLKAGTSKKRLTEIHGNVFIEYCEKCKAEYRRDFCVDLWSTNCYRESWYIKCKTCGLNHYTSRICEKKFISEVKQKTGSRTRKKKVPCGGKLRDTIVNFGDMLHLDGVCGGYNRALEENEKADLAICLGSSLLVPPACELPTHADCMVICNLQSTPFDDSANVRLFGTCDEFMQAVLHIVESQQ